jgi:hypothetical protein
MAGCWSSSITDAGKSNHREPPSEVIPGMLVPSLLIRLTQRASVFQLSIRSQNATTELLRQHRRKIAANTVLPSATPEQRDLVLRDCSDEELLARAKRASPGTVERTETRASSVVAQAETAGVNVWTLVEERSGNYNSWYTFKAGVQRYLEDKIVETRREVATWQRDSQVSAPSGGLEEAGVRLLMRMNSLATALLQVPSGAPERFKGDGRAKRYAKKSKSASIRTVDEDWRERVAEMMTGDLKLLFLVQCVTGCRPQELANGVQVRLCRDGTMVTRVRGAKCDQFVGQPSRSLRLSAASGVTRMLGQMLKAGRSVDSRDYDLGQVNTYAKRVARACASAFPSRKGRKKLSPYSVRHQFKADLVAMGWTKVEIAMAMGHSTTRSGTAYGQGGRGGGSGVKPIAIKAQRPVKLRGTYPMARSGASSTRAATAKVGMPSRKRPKL